MVRDFDTQGWAFSFFQGQTFRPGNKQSRLGFTAIYSFLFLFFLLSLLLSFPWSSFSHTSLRCTGAGFIVCYILNLISFFFKKSLLCAFLTILEHTKVLPQ